MFVPDFALPRKPPVEALRRPGLAWSPEPGASNSVYAIRLTVLHTRTIQTLFDVWGGRSRLKYHFHL